jgi:hypothetical protein
MEGFLNLVNDLLVTYITCCNDYDILAIIIGCLVVLQHINTDSRHVIAVTFDWLSNHVLSECIEV